MTKEMKNAMDKIGWTFELQEIAETFYTHDELREMYLASDLSAIDFYLKVIKEKVKKS